MRMRTRIMRRGYKYTGWTAQRNQLIYESYRRGAEIEGLAKAWTLGLEACDESLRRATAGQ
jgi:hypothetical protein